MDEYTEIKNCDQGGAVVRTGTKRCIACAEEILFEAKLCKFCKTDQTDARFFRTSATSEKGQTSTTQINIEESNPTISKDVHAVPLSDPRKKFKSAKFLGAVALSIGLLALLFSTNSLQSDQESTTVLNPTQKQRVDEFLASISDGYDDELRTVAECVSLYYNDLNATFLDPGDRSIPMALVQDCVERNNSTMTCGQADDGTGPICGLAGTQSGYSIASVFGAMIGQVGPNESSSSSDNEISSKSADEQEVSDSSSNSSSDPGQADSNRQPAPTEDSSQAESQEEDYEMSGPKVWVPTLENIRDCSLDYYDEKCPHDYSEIIVETQNTFGVVAEELVQKMISAGLCEEWPPENYIWPRTDVEDACLSQFDDGFYVATGDAEIWGLIYRNPYGEVLAAGDGWLVFAVYTSLEDMQVVAALLGGEAWQRGF